MSEFKRCPFCGGTDIEARQLPEEDSWYIFCNDCGVMCGYSMERKEAVEAWNTREGVDKEVNERLHLERTWANGDTGFE